MKLFQNEVDWYKISQYQILSEDFIREFQDKVYWHLISEYQHLSITFIKEFKNKIHWLLLLHKYGLSSYYYSSDHLNQNEFIDLAIRLISLKAFQ